LFVNNCIPHRSLNNLSGSPGEIRWSLDLRWQDFKQSYGFHGLAEGMKFRKAEQPDWRPTSEDWDNFLKFPRIQKYKAEISGDSVPEDAMIEKFTLDTTITGPWMKNWELSHKNRHTNGLSKEGGSTWHSHKVGKVVQTP